MDFRNQRKDQIYGIKNQSKGEHKLRNLLRSIFRRKMSKENKSKTIQIV